MPILSKVYRGLLISLVFLGLVFIFGTIYGVFFQKRSLENKQVEILGKSGEEHIFTGIGRIRIPTRDPQPGILIVSVSFVYYPEDKFFSEELALRIGDFRNIIMNYFGSFSIAELQQLSEESNKTELLRRFNATLRLGKIETLYFSDFLIVG